jgi:hypothetical protein
MVDRQLDINGSDARESQSYLAWIWERLLPETVQVGRGRECPVREQKRSGCGWEICCLRDFGPPS